LHLNGDTTKQDKDVVKTTGVHVVAGQVADVDLKDKDANDDQAG